MTDAPDVLSLIEQLRDPDWQVRYDAANQLKIVGDQRAVPALIEVLQDDNLTVRFVGAMTLGIIKDPRAVRPLIDMLLSTDDHDVLWAAAWALSELGALSSEPLINVLSTTDSLTRDVAADVLGGIGDARAILPLLEALLEYGAIDYPDTGRYGAADALERFGELSVAPFVQALKHHTAEIRARAAQALGTIGRPQAIPALAVCLADTEHVFTETDDKVRVCDIAASALRNIGTPEALRAVELWEDDTP